MKNRRLVSLLLSIIILASLAISPLATETDELPLLLQEFTIESDTVVELGQLTISDVEETEEFALTPQQLQANSALQVEKFKELQAEFAVALDEDGYVEYEVVEEFELSDLELEEFGIERFSDNIIAEEDAEKSNESAELRLDITDGAVQLQAAGLADLYIYNLVAMNAQPLRVGVFEDFEFKLANIGQTMSEGTEVAIYMNGNLLGYMQIGPLNPMNGIYGQVQLKASTEGSHLLKLTANASYMVPESNYSNNTVQGTFNWANSATGTFDLAVMDVVIEGNTIVGEEETVFQIIIGNYGANTAFNVPVEVCFYEEYSGQQGSLRLNANDIRPGYGKGYIVRGTFYHHSPLEMDVIIDPDNAFAGRDTNSSNNFFSSNGWQIVNLRPSSPQFAGWILPNPNFNNISDLYGTRPGGRIHTGLDMTYPGHTRGSSLAAVFDGKVVKSGFGTGGTGNMIIYKVNQTVAYSPVYVAFYHLLNAPSQQENDPVYQGEILGQAANSGLNLPADQRNHLHLEIRNYPPNNNWGESNLTGTSNPQDYYAYVDFTYDYGVQPQAGIMAQRTTLNEEMQSLQFIDVVMIRAVGEEAFCEFVQDIQKEKGFDATIIDFLIAFDITPEEYQTIMDENGLSVNLERVQKYYNLVSE